MVRWFLVWMGSENVVRFCAMEMKLTRDNKRHEWQTKKIKITDSLLQRLNRPPRHIFAYTQGLDPRLGHFFQAAYGPNVGIRGVSRTELACSCSGPTAFSVLPSAGITPCASREDGILAGLNRS